MKFINHPITGKPDLMVTLSVLVVSVAAIRFLFDGVTFTLAGHVFGFGNLDPIAYGSFLTPVLATHGYVGVRGWSKGRRSNQPDNPDESDV